MHARALRQNRPASSRIAAARLVAVFTFFALFALFAGLGAACKPSDAGPRHRERDPGRERECRDPALPRAYFYPAENRTDYKPDDPHKDGCRLLVADHLFCCPDAPRPTDR